MRSKTKVKIQKIVLSIIFILTLFLIVLLFSKKVFPQREFRLTEGQGVVFKEVRRTELVKEKVIIETSRFYQDKKNYRSRIYQGIPKFTFLYPKELMRSNTKLTGFEEYFTLPPILEQEIYSYPGVLTNPEKTEKNSSLSIRLFTLRGKKEDIETWFEKFQEESHFQKDRLEINGLDFVKYQGLFGHKYNQIFLTANQDLVVIIILVSEDKENFNLGSKMLEVILATFKWL